MTVFMFWMFGNNISIFVLFPIIQTLTTAVGGLLNMQKGKSRETQFSSPTRAWFPV
jgi:hypothetical protein